MAERKKRPTDPFVIRGHHLSLYSEVQNLPPSRLRPNRGIKALVYKIAREDLHIGMYDFHPLPGEEEIGDINYAQDVAGNSPQEVNIFEKRLIKTFKRFKRLPGEHPVVIVEGEKDELCKCCITGKHCASLTEMIADMQNIPKFSLAAESLGLEDAVKFSRQTVVFKDNSSTPLRKLETTAGVVKKVLDVTSQDKWQTYI